MLRLTPMICCVGLLLSASGCQTSPKQVQVPTGEWHGLGRFTALKWSAPSESAQAAIEQTATRAYNTQLSIEVITDAEPAQFRFNILSKRGQLLPDHGKMGTVTHMCFVLTEGGRLGDDVVIYHVTAGGLEIELDREPKLDNDPSPHPIDATCMRVDDEVVLQIRYGDEFHDEYVFNRSDVMKSGAFWRPPIDTVSSGTAVHWTEALERQSE